MLPERSIHVRHEHFRDAFLEIDGFKHPGEAGDKDVVEGVSVV